VLNLLTKIFLIRPILVLLVGLIWIVSSHYQVLENLYLETEQTSIFASIDDNKGLLDDLNRELTELKAEGVLLGNNISNLSTDLEIVGDKIAAKLKRISDLKNNPNLWGKIKIVFGSKKLPKKIRKEIETIEAEIEELKKEKKRYLNSKTSYAEKQLSNKESILSTDQKITKINETIESLKYSMSTKLNWYQYLVSELIAIKFQLLLLWLGINFWAVGVKVFNFFINAPFAARTSAIQLHAEAEGSELSTELAQNEITIRLNPEEELYVKPGWVHTSDIGSSCTCYVYSWGKLLASYSLSLLNLIHFPPSESVRSVVIASNRADHELIPVCLNNHPGLAVRGDHIVAIKGNLKIDTYLRLFSLSSWIFGKFRYYALSGTGTIYLFGYEGIGQVKDYSAETRFKEANIIAFDIQSAFRPIRTETFSHYAGNVSGLFDLSFLNSYPVFRQVSVTGNDRSPFFRSFLDDVLNFVGKIFGF
jgi:uncharacterized protein (AIM24 family)